MFTPDYLRQPPAWFHTRVLVGAGTFLRPAFVQQHRITHVINCAFQDDSPAWFRDVFPDRYVCLEAIDSADQNIMNWYPTFEQTMQRFLREGNGTVYVHCQAGINRSAFLALLYVCKNFNMSIDGMIVATKRQRPCMFSNTTFRRQVEEFINGCLSREKNEGVGILNDDRRDAGLGSPRYSSELERL